MQWLYLFGTIQHQQAIVGQNNFQEINPIVRMIVLLDKQPLSEVEPSSAETVKWSTVFRSTLVNGDQWTSFNAPIDKPQTDRFKIILDRRYQITKPDSGATKTFAGATTGNDWNSGVRINVDEKIDLGAALGKNARAVFDDQTNGAGNPICTQNRLYVGFIVKYFNENKVFDTFAQVHAELQYTE